MNLQMICRILQFRDSDSDPPNRYTYGTSVREPTYTLSMYVVRRFTGPNTYKFWKRHGGGTGEA